MNPDILPSDWERNPGMALRTARYACIEHESLAAMIDVCPPENSDGLFDVDTDAWGIAKLYTSHDTLEGVQFREQRQVETEEDLAIVVRELADVFYEFQSETDSPEEPTAGVTTPAPDGDERKDVTLYDFE